MPPRTKACALCRKKRIKCDATLPACLMCTRTGKQCPGPVDGPLIIDMTSQTVKRTKKEKKTKPAPGPRKPPEEKEPLPATSTAVVPAKPDLAIASVAQPSQAFVINQAFFANFLAYFTSDGEDKDLQNRLTWMHKLPEYSSDGTNQALTYALRATALAYCGHDAGNPQVLNEALRMYGRALHIHARLLQNTANPTKEVTTHMVSTSVLLSIFEAMLSTTGDAYREHVQGAAKILEMAGPGICAHGVLCQLFFHIRTQMAFVYLTTEKSKSISVQKILTDTLQYRKLPVFQKLMSLIAKLAEIYVSKANQYSPQIIQVLQVYYSVRTQILTLYQDYQVRGAAKNNPVSYKDERGQKMYRDSFTAMVMSYFHAAHILISVLATRLGVTFVVQEDHSEPILECVRYLDAKRIGCSYMRMAMPLFLVGLHSHSLEHQDQAVALFESWKTGGMAGLSYLALETIQKRRAEEAKQLEEAYALYPVQNWYPSPESTATVEELGF